MNIKTSGEYGIGGCGSAKSAPMCTTERMASGLDENLREAHSTENRVTQILTRLTGASTPGGAETRCDKDNEGSVFGRILATSTAIQESMQRTTDMLRSIESEIGL